MAVEIGRCSGDVLYPRAFRMAGLSAALALAAAPSVLLAEERDDRHGFALDAVTSSMLGVVREQDVVIVGLDYRVLYDAMEEYPFLGYSVWSFSLQENFMNFCIPVYCSDPIEFDYHLAGDSICLFATEDEIEGCFELVPRDGQLD